MGGFSIENVRKEDLLSFEQNIEGGIYHLKLKDPILKMIIEKEGDCNLKSKSSSLWEALLESIVYQQLHGKAAQKIWERILNLNHENKLLDNQKLLLCNYEELKSCVQSK